MGCESNSEEGLDLWKYNMKSDVKGIFVYLMYRFKLGQDRDKWKASHVCIIFVLKTYLKIDRPIIEKKAII